MKGITILQCSHVSHTVYLYRRGPWTSQIGHRAMSNTDGSWDLAGQTIRTNPYSTSVHRKVGLTTAMGLYGTKIVITCAHRSRTPILRVIANFRRQVGCCTRRDLPHCSPLPSRMHLVLRQQLPSIRLIGHLLERVAVCTLRDSIYYELVLSAGRIIYSINIRWICVNVHRFYQHIEDSSDWDWRMCWGHASSADLINWVHEPLALRPTPGGAPKHSLPFA